MDHLRQEHENPTEWKLRKTFLEAHRDKLPLDRLVCMSCCFINVEMHGCRYPDQVMKSLRGLIEEIKFEVEMFRAKVKSRDEVVFVKATKPDSATASSKPAAMKAQGPYGMNFVKASSGQGAAQLQSVSTNQQQTPAVSYQKPEPIIKKGNPKTAVKGMTFVKANKEYHSTDVTTSCQGKASVDVTENQADARFFGLGNTIRELLFKDGTKNAIEIFYMGASKMGFDVAVDFSTSMDRTHVCKVSINCVLVAKEEDTNKKGAKHKAFEVAMGKLCKSHLKIVKEGQHHSVLMASDEPFQENSPSTSDQPQTQPQPSLKYAQTSKITMHSKQPTRKRNIFQSNQPLGQFYLYEPVIKHNGCNAASILRMSADFNRTSLDYDMSHGAHVQCTVYVSDQPIAKAVGDGQAAVKSEASEQALQSLRQDYYTIQIKPKNHDSADKVTKEELEGENPEKKAIPDSNIGNKLLKMMGWAGGGVGKSGQGIAEPVDLESVINREGLGLSSSRGITKEFKETIYKLLHDYAVSNDEKDLVFSPTFSKDERVIIHKEAQKLKLKSKSYNEYKKADADRYLVISRKKTPDQLFRQLLHAGGETDTHRLVEPGQHEDLMV